MKTNEDKNLEKLVDTIMKDSKIETPSIDFTAKVMAQVVASNKSEVYVYKPLISKPVFLLIFGCFIALMLFLEPQKDSWINHLNIEKFHNSSITTLFNFSKFAIYSTTVGTLMLLIQISYLKKYFDKSL